MRQTNWMTATVTIAGLGLMTPARGDQIADLQAQVQALNAKVTQMQADQGDNWLNERRAEEVKGLILEVLSDADTRASLLNDGALAGHDGSSFFIKSADGSFAMFLNGQIDLRYIWNSRTRPGLLSMKTNPRSR